jgi:uncharacterized 2Fe-2S/4Fe-4S cluster protein (DUF4445 family)
VCGLDAQLTPPTLEAPQADSQNLWQALAEHGIPAGQIDLRVQHTLSQIIRDNNWQIRAALRGDEIVAAGAPTIRWLGLAVDIGTTKVAGYMLDMETGHTLASKGLMNPQISYGEDGVSRIVAASKS